MRKAVYLLAISAIIALVSTLLSWLYSERVSQEGLFSLYRGPAYNAHGWPWWFLKVYESGSLQFELIFFLLDFLFWFVVASLVLTGVFYLLTSIRKIIQP